MRKTRRGDAEVHAARSKREVMLAMASRSIEKRRWPFSFPANPAV
jgi:hypothetical protein